MGQEDAVDALQFGLKNRFRGDNVFVRGLSGFGRMALINQMIGDTVDGDFETPDRCYVHNFDAPDQPRMLSLPPGRGREFRRAMDEFAEFVRTDLPAYFSSDIVKSKQKQFVNSTQEEIQALGKPLDEELKNADLTLVPVTVGQNMVPVIMPVEDGKPVSFEEMQKRRLEGAISEDEFKVLSEKISGFEKQLNEVGEQVSSLQVEQQEKLQQMMADEARNYVRARMITIRQRFNLAQVIEFLDQTEEDLISQRLLGDQGQTDYSRFYRVNLVAMQPSAGKRPVVSIANPTMANLLGTIETEFTQPGNATRSDHLMIKPGALLQADGGFLVVEAREILSEPGAWSVLLRTLRSGLFDMTNLDPSGFWPVPRLKPEAIPVDLKVILVGDPETHALLSAAEPRFVDLFKILADFGDTIARDAEGYRAYATMLSRLVQRDELQPLNKAAVAALIEHGARICSQGDRLTTRFGRIAELAREASFLSQQSGNAVVSGPDVSASIARSKHRADLPARRFRRLIANRTIRIETEGERVGEVNGLAVTSTGSLIYGFPTRITATIGPGNAGMINIERESDLSGAIHTKGFMILSGLLRSTLNLDHPMAFSASIAFEQSYGGIDGDSASGAEFCCLMSALTGFSLDQQLAMTGAVDQKGNMLPIGGATEKVEGFYDACRALGFTGSQGVIIPATNASELMLREDVVSAVAGGEFSVYPIMRIEQALELFKRVDPGEPPPFILDFRLCLARAHT
ncbi:MAG: AAA family ATPase, partial [Gammaproteobacteria bacterium]|nr:AAA family ATPase [Gammaproteobacteria bacterium]